MDFYGLENKYKTPLYIYDLDQIKQQFRHFKNAFSGKKTLVCYALKANSNLSVINTLAKLGSGADCVSIGEIKKALLGGIEKYRIIFSGVGKSSEDINEALKLDILFLNVESEQEFFEIESIAHSLGKKARISIRINPNIDAKTHPYISTGLNENKFGVNVELASRLYLYAKNSPYLEAVGVHFHIGSQILELKPIVEATQKIAKFAKSLLVAGIDLKFFDIGGGIGICYENEKTIDPYEYAQGILSATKDLDLTIITEPGRYLVGKSGYLLSKVLYEKTNHSKRFVIVDAAMNDLIRPSLYQAHHRVQTHHINPIKNNEKSLADIVGPVCESSDYLAKNISLPPLKSGDLIVFENVGAYGYSMSSNYNTRMRAAEIGIENGQDRILKHRDNFENIVADELQILEKNQEISNGTK